MFKQFFLLTLKGIAHRKLRSWLTVVGVVIAISLVVIIQALGSGIQNAVSSQMSMFGGDLIIIFPGELTNPFSSLVGGLRFKEEDITNLKYIEGVEYVMPADIATLNVEYKGEKKSVMTNGSPWKEVALIFESSQGVELYDGSWPTEESSNEVVLGFLVATELFKNDPKVGDELIIKSRRMKIAGFVSEIGNQQDDNTLYVSREVFSDLTGIKGKTMTGMLKIEKGANLELIAKQVEYELSKQDEVQEFSVITPEKVGAIVGGVLTVIELGLVFIALFSLIVGAVGIMNTMYTSVLERTKQIGIMKAIGASSEAILSLFLLESGMIGAVGGIFGIILGLILAYLVSLLAAYGGVGGLFSFASLDFYGLAVIVIITFIVGILSGVLPARSAAKLEPAEALRYE